MMHEFAIAYQASRMEAAKSAARENREESRED